MEEDICHLLLYNQLAVVIGYVCPEKLLSWHCYEAVALPVENSERLPNLFFDVSVLMGLD